MFQTNEKIYIFGTTLISSIVYKFIAEMGLKVNGYICDFSSAAHFQGEKVFSRDDMEAQNDAFTVINCSLTNFKSISQYYQKNELIRHISFYELARNFPTLLNQIEFFDDLTNQISNSEEKYIQYSSMFEDERSRYAWLSIFEARKSLSFDKQDFEFDTNQYFPDFIHLTSNEVMIDAGSNRGDTVDSFISRTGGKFKKIHIFEPQQYCIEKCMERFYRYKNIEYHPKVLSSECGTVTFLDDFGSGCKISTSGRDYPTVSIDHAVQDEVTFLKIDVEGAELAVLKGAKQIIKINKPKIAVCVYHKQQHFIEIPELLMEFRSDYKIFFRHHSPGIFESVMYFV